MKVVVERRDQLPQSGVFLGEVVSVGVVELSREVVDTGFSLFDCGAKCLGEGFGVEGSFSP